MSSCDSPDGQNAEQPERRVWKQSPLLADLKQRYPYQFEEPLHDCQQNIALGWLPLFERLCADVDVLLDGNPQGFRWCTLKVKLGWARWYPCFTLTLDQETKDKLYELKYAAEEKTQTTCFACGAACTSKWGTNLEVCCPVHSDEGAEFWEKVWPDNWMGWRPSK